MELALINGRVIDPASGRSEAADLWVKGGRIARIAPGLGAGKAAEVIDAQGCVVCPGLIDIHVHFREPGFESKETIATGSRAAARGGFTTVVMMPNTDPPIDNAGTVEFCLRKAREEAVVRVLTTACATKGRAGRDLTEMAELKAAGAVAVTDDGSDIASSWVMRRVLEYADMCGLVYMAHCEDASLMEGGVMNEGYTSTRLGLPGLPKAMEEIMIDRNIRIAELTGAAIHIQHVSTAEGMAIIGRAKRKGLRVTCETAPHYWTLTDTAIEDWAANAKMNPPLREESDREAVRAAIADGTVDCIATDHAPHTVTEKDVEMQFAPFGILGLETCLGLTLSELVRPGVISLERAIELLTCAPARILGLDSGHLSEGGPADIAVFDPEATWTVDPNAFASKSRNTPFAGRTLHGVVKATVCGGRIAHRA